MADVYRVNCAYLAETHSHVTGLNVKKWSGSKFDDPVDLTKAEAITKISNGDVFQTQSRDGSSTLTLVSEACGSDCPVVVLKTVADDTKKDNLDYMKCSS
jgi:hypothetical protein